MITDRLPSCAYTGSLYTSRWSIEGQRQRQFNVWGSEKSVSPAGCQSSSRATYCKEALSQVSITNVTLSETVHVVEPMSRPLSITFPQNHSVMIVAPAVPHL
ncbi:hypothetical protein AcW2_005340 [Taiwanofungus camphoratus]|nr:hypothetical protein AcW2_005340 [Antrodia cinnamomea]